MENYVTGFTKGAYDVIMAADVPNAFDQIAAKLSALPKKYDVDMSDNMLSVRGVPLSFLKDNKNMTIRVMTIEEARKLDAISAKRRRWRR